MRSLWYNLRFGMRLIFRNPGFSSIAVLILALGIGANTATFSIINTLILRPQSFAKPEQLVALFNKNTRLPDSFRPFSYPNYQDLRNRNTVFSDILAHSLALVGIREGDTTRRVTAEIITANYFQTLGVPLWRGRTFTSAEEKPGAAIPVVIVSYDYWRRAGQDPDFIGKTININARDYTVVGIGIEGFTGRTVAVSSGIWLPLGVFESTVNDFLEFKALSERDNHCLFVVGRLKTGVTAREADSQLAVLGDQLEQAFPKENENQRVITGRLTRFQLSTRPNDERSLTGISILLGGMSGLVLLIACFNLANMMMARGTSRRREFAIRMAIGCGRHGLRSQLLVEGFLLSAVGALVGLALSLWVTRLLVYSMNAVSPFPIRLALQPDIRVFAAMLAFCLVSTLIFSTGPARKAVRPGVMELLKEDTPGYPRYARRLGSSSNLLIVSQIALSLVLLTAAGFFMMGAWKATKLDPGFSLQGGIVVEVDAALAGYEEPRARQSFRKVQETLRALPGAASVSTAAAAPFGMITLGRYVIRAEDAGRDTPEMRAEIPYAAARFNAVGADYFRTLGVPLLRGRTVTDAEEIAGGKAPVAIIDEALAARLWPGEDPLQKRICFRKEDEVKREQTDLLIVGLVPPLIDSLLEPQAVPHVYVPFGQVYQSDVVFHVKTSGSAEEDEAVMLSRIRRAIQIADPNLPIVSLKTMKAQLDGCMELWLFRTGARVFSFLGGLALFLAVVGVYAVKGYAVSLRTREIGIRMALGATVPNTIWLVLQEALWLILAGTVIGLGLSLAVGRVLSGLLVQVSPLEPIVLFAMPILLGATSLLAAFLPARRAARTDPLLALRSE
jgi:predicted permease